MSIIFPMSPSLVAKAPMIYRYVESRTSEKFVAYLLHSNYRVAVSLEPWIRNQVSNPTPETKSLADNIGTGRTTDETAINCLEAVMGLLKYVPDQVHWGMSEYWQTTQETVNSREGDCEDGAILLYVLCRLKGIPADRLMLFAGNVVGGGHCWLAYRPDNYPLNFVFLDWCYWPTQSPIGQRNFYALMDVDIYGESPLDGSVDDRYVSIWFGFNEEHSSVSFTYHPELAQEF